ncbi:oligosaccharide flippase family protein [Rhodoferax sp.]|uniref:oligosaccharide flippase family protein n=1 Tax=Rhodoferax sp. TaxID=50421 RepID=UPI002602F098|nr:oligosaccharide flippase family protein [Rhodoferax sp.]MDD2918621.1 oligosaccharide flippase family protein [Rhodoferax sp.]
MAKTAPSSRQFVNSAVWSLMGTVVPMLAALAAVPWLMHYMGQERLGVLSLVWVVVGYFSFLDMGLGRAVTVAVAADRSGRPRALADEIHVVGSALVLLLAVGLAMTAVLGSCIAIWGAPFKLSSAELINEVRLALLWTLPSLPLLLLSSAFRGHLEGVGAFRALNQLRIPTGILLVAIPCLTAYFSPSLVWACLGIFLVRLLHLLVLSALTAHEIGHAMAAMPAVLLRHSTWPWLRRLLSFGGWVTVSNVVGPVIVYVDRFVIGATLAASSVAVYAVPFDMVSRLPVLVAALCSVLLPELARLSSLASATDPSALRRSHQLVRRSSIFSALVVAVLVVVGALAAPWALALWLGEDFAQQSGTLTQVLLVAFGVNAVAQIPFTALQAVGKVRAVALLHSAELVPYAVLVFFAISWLGLVGAAWAWLLRSIIDYGVLGWMWHKQTLSPSMGIKF